jgi:hypothetical protein
MEETTMSEIKLLTKAAMALRDNPRFSPEAQRRLREKVAAEIDEFLRDKLPQKGDSFYEKEGELPYDQYQC